MVCLAFVRLTSEKKQKKTGYVVFVHFRTFGREIFIRVIEFGWCGSIPLVLVLVLLGGARQGALEVQLLAVAR